LLTATVTKLCYSPKLKFPHVVSLILKTKLLLLVKGDTFLQTMLALNHVEILELLLLQHSRVNHTTHIHNFIN
jgi:hypothetical protein